MPSPSHRLRDGSLPLPRCGRGAIPCRSRTLPFVAHGQSSVRSLDVAVIGAGAAGIAAARRLAADSGVSVLVIEARERPGGRAWTVEADGIPMDLGCEWLHSADRNVLAPLAKQLGFGINERRPDWTTRLRYSREGIAAEG